MKSKPAKVLSRQQCKGQIENIERKENNFWCSRVFGMFSFMRPVFMVKDAEVLKQMMIKDFDHFVNHDSEFSAHGDRYFARSMLHLLGDDWREMRNAL